MEQLIELSPTEIKLAFVASCIEGTARRLGKSYQEIYARMKSVGMIANYILPNYEVLVTILFSALTRIATQHIFAP
ncbi:DUF3791 domain-containing protein [Bacteroides caecimuris]|uniref:DUF3791 domain-containing protein n=1 Tax=Bacteroides caecimuris TaxID=1796613 RepID=A0A4S2CKF1_9BACE|nr:DUF3791 domain-containing protein [Bacteroides caecimuris]TGY28475.1 DUF3791 domain-containing protein [Bacteroides caecimuris]